MKHSHPEYQYLDLMADIMDNGRWKLSHSTGVKLKSVFGRICRYDLSQGFPLLTTKKVFSRGVIHELLWFLSGSSNIKYLVENNVHIWDEWAYKKYTWAVADGKARAMTFEEFMAKAQSDKTFLKKWGELGPVYGVQWRRWSVNRKKSVDQLGWAIEKIKKYPGQISEFSGEHLKRYNEVLHSSQIQKIKKSA